MFSLQSIIFNNNRIIDNNSAQHTGMSFFPKLKIVIVTLALLKVHVAILRIKF